MPTTRTPKVLISDQMSPKAAEIFRARGIEVDEITGLSKDELIKIIGNYDGLAIRSSTKVTEEVLAPASCPRPMPPPRPASGKRTASWASK
jgi:phosphoglycerate dehydrogenase-like enzyme